MTRERAWVDIEPLRRTLQAAACVPSPTPAQVEDAKRQFLRLAFSRIEVA